MLKLFILSLLGTFSSSSFANEPQSFLPLPNTEYIRDCSDGLHVMKTGPIKITKRKIETVVNGKTVSKTIDQYSMNFQVTGANSPKEIVTMEPWNRFVILYSLKEENNVLTEAKLVSGNLDKIELIVGNEYSGQVSLKTSLIDKPASRIGEWKVNIKILSVQKITFNNEVLLVYKIKTVRNKITSPPGQFTAEFLYSPKLQQFYKSTMNFPGTKKPYECTLKEVKSMKPTTSEPAATTPPKTN